MLLPWMNKDTGFTASFSEQQKSGEESLLRKILPPINIYMVTIRFSSLMNLLYNTDSPDREVCTCVIHLDGNIK